MKTMRGNAIRKGTDSANISIYDLLPREACVFPSPFLKGVTEE